MCPLPLKANSNPLCVLRVLCGVLSWGEATHKGHKGNHQGLSHRVVAGATGRYRSSACLRSAVVMVEYISSRSRVSQGLLGAICTAELNHW